MAEQGVGIELGAARSRCAVADGGGGRLVVDLASAVGIGHDGQAVVGESSLGLEGTITDFVGQLGRAEPFIVGGTPYGAEALTAQLLRHVFDAAGGAASATALVHDDAWGPYQLDLVREAVRLAAIGPVHLVAPAVAATYDADLAMGAARWAWEHREDGGASVPVPGSPLSARTALIGVGAGAALAVGGGVAAAGAAGGAGAAGASLGDFAAQGGSSLGDFASSQGGSSLGDFASSQGGSSLSDFAEPGSRLGDFAQPPSPPEPPQPPSTPQPTTPSSKPKGRIPKVPAAIAAAVVAVGVVAGVALASSNGDDNGGDAEQAAVSTTADEARSTSTTPGATSTTAGGSERLRTPFLLACGGEGPPGAGTDGPAAEASCGRPLDVAVADDGTVYFADAEVRAGAFGTVRAVLPDGSLRSFDFGEVDGKRVDQARAVAVAGDGTIYVADFENHRILRRSPSGQVSRYAGTADGAAAGDVSSGSAIPVADGVPARENPLGDVDSMVVDGDGNLVLTDIHNDLVQRIDATGTITVIAGKDRSVGSGDSVPARAANLTSLLQGGPVAVAVDPDGVLHLAGGSTVWRYDGTTLTRVAGTRERPKDDRALSGTSALQTALWIEDIAFAPDGTLYVAEVTDLADVWRVPLAGASASRVLGGQPDRTIEGPTADRIQPSGLAVDAKGRLLITEAGTAYEMVRRFPAPTG
jgi:sugar lactone lactonase YvrE